MRSPIGPWKFSRFCRVVELTGVQFQELAVNDDAVTIGLLLENKWEFHRDDCINEMIRWVSTLKGKKNPTFQ